MARHRPTQTVQYRGFWTVPNMVTILRPIFFLPVLRILINAIDRPPVNWRWFWLGGFILAVDSLDGWIARRFNQRSKIGMILDPTADKVVNNACLVCMTAILHSRVGVGYFVALCGVIFLRFCQDVYSTWLYWQDFRAGTIKGANFPAKVKGWTELIGVALGYAWLVKAWPGGAISSAKLMLCGCMLAFTFSCISLRQKLASRKAL